MIKKELTVRANQNAIGLRPPAFKVYRELVDGTLLVPRFFRAGVSKETYVKGNEASRITFVGSLMSHQKDALNQFKGNGVLCLPCGKGKTATALAIASKYRRRTLVIVHKEFLASQWRDRIGQFCPGATVGLIQGDTFNIDCDFVIAMIQTLCSREFARGVFDSIGLVIVDEAHHIGAPAFSKALLHFRSEYTLGLTATPERKDGLTKILYWFLGPIFYSMEQDSSTIKHIKVPFDHPEFRKGPILNKIGKISLSHMINLLTDIPERNDLIIKLIRECIKRNRNILVLSDRRSHCEYLQAQIGHDNAGLYIGGMTPCQHEEASRKKVIIATFCLAYEGLDIPTLDTLFLVTPHSDIKQAVGRITRNIHSDKEVYDIVDAWSVCESMYYRRKKIFEPVHECLI
jgi:superfamily II DNA or RNA helicase